MKVSILIPVHNAAPFLKECLNSILAQSYTDWELIAIDDFSTDTSYEILKSYADKNDNIQVFKNNQKGIIPALRLAYSKSKGQLITRMDADDIMPKIKLETLSQLLIKSGPGHLAVGMVKYFSSEGLGEGYLKYENWLNDLTSRQSNFSEIYKECCIPSPCWMCYREDLESCGAFNPDLYPEDYDLAFRFRNAGLKIVSSPEVLHLWRDHPVRSSRTDDNYKDNRFLELKAHQFLCSDYNPDKELIIWGLGKKGKQLAKLLLAKDIDFAWITNNENKIGKDIYGKIVESETALQSLSNSQILVLVANEEEQLEIKKRLANIKSTSHVDSFLFC